MAATPWLDDQEMDAWRAVLEVSVRLLQRLDDELAATHGLSLADYEVLIHLAEAPGRRRRMSTLAERALMSRSRLTYRVNRLEDAGLVVRQPCDEDRRGWYAVLTSAGAELVARAAPTHVHGVRRHLLDHVRGGEMVPLTTVLARVAAELESDPLEPSLSSCDVRR